MEHYKHIFVVLVYKNTDVLEGFFQSLEEKVCDYKVILVNSFYDDISEAACKKWAVDKECDFISVPNKGYGAGNNVGIEYAIEHYDFDFLVISNSDIIVKKLDALDKYIGKTAVIGPETIMLTGKRQNPGQGRFPTLTAIYFLLCRKGYKKDSHILITLAHICSRLNKILTYLRIISFSKREMQVFSIHGSFFIMTRNAVRVLHPVFSNEMFLYNEELYLGLRAKQKGVPLLYSKDNEVNHLEGASSTGDFWKQYPEFKKSFTILDQYIKEGFFDIEKINKKKKNFMNIRSLFKNLGGAFYKSRLLRRIALEITYVKYKIKYLGKVKLRGLTYFYMSKGSEINIGKGTVINNYTTSNMFGIWQNTIFYVKNKGKVTIGDNCGISGASFCAMEEITVGDRVQIGANTKIMDNDMHSLDPIERANDERKNIKHARVSIGDDCFIGAQSIILKGTVLGNNCIVGAGSVVHGVFPDNAVIAGNPAKIIKANVLKQ